ncbi:MAG: hypothetical protein M3444_04870 [Acidobacteriota bacterium]|nr:hypothetical protein [Acidobacteriota bacterium]
MKENKDSAAAHFILYPSSFILELLCREDLCWSSMKQSENLIGAFPHGSSFEEVQSDECRMQN